MTRFLAIIFLFVSTSAFCQEASVVARYKNVQRTGNFLTRWYFDLRGTSLVWKQSLTLYSDSTYRYVYRGGECGTFDEDRKGSWSVTGDTLTLSTAGEMFEWRYVMANKKLYNPDTGTEQYSDNGK